MGEGMMRRIARRAGVPDLVEVLAERLPSSDLQSLLLDVYRRRARRASPAQVLRAYERSRFTSPSGASPELLLRTSLLAFECTPPGAEAVELSLLAPLGAVSAVSTVAQDSVVGALRGLEVIADPTNVMALEGARRRRRLLEGDARDATAITFAAAQRVVRAQRFDGAGQTQHFHLSALCTVGRDEGAGRFELRCLREHVETHLRLLARASELGLLATPTELRLTDFSGSYGSRLQEQVIDPLARSAPELRVTLAPERERGRGYYDPLCFELLVTAPDGAEFSLADGGVVDWTSKLLGNRKERCFISALGTEQLCTRFRAVAE